MRALTVTVKVRVFIAALVVGTFLVVVYIFSPNDTVGSAIPEGVEIVGEFSEGWWGNGDYKRAMKLKMTASQFSIFVKGLGLREGEDLRSFSNSIGFKTQTHSLPSKANAWWDEPVSPEKKVYRRYPRYFVSVSYSNGFAYFFVQGW